MTPSDLLARGLEELRLALPADLPRRLLAYVDLLVKWNRTYNLTAVREPAKMVTHHLLDSLAVLPHLEGGTLADLGSGGGLPGIPMALVQPERPISLVESNHKKAAFLQQATIELGMRNVTVVHARVEDWRPEAGIQCVVSRAFAELGEFLSAGRLLAASGAQFAAMKGVYPHDELARLPDDFHCERIVPLSVPFVEGARHLVLCRRKAAA